MSKDKGSRYAGRLVCVSDYVSGKPLERTVLTPSKALNIIRELNKGRTKQVERLWSIVSSVVPKVGNKDIQEESWDESLAIKEYQMQAREIKAALKLKEVYESEGADLFGTSNSLGLMPWSFYGWMELDKKMPWVLVLAIEELEQTGNWSVKAAIDLWREKTKAFILAYQKKKEQRENESS